jgi:phosphopantetheinyl transferase
MDKCKKGFSKDILLQNLSHYFNKKISTNDLVKNDNGKPSIAGLFFSISHSKNHLVQAFSLKSELGIDVEFIQYKRNILALAKRYFHAKEFEFLQAQSAAHACRLFYSLWSRKEAVCKAQGGRLWYYLHDNYLTADNHMATTIKGLSLTQLDCIPKFSLVIASQNSTDKIEIIHG